MSSITALSAAYLDTWTNPDPDQRRRAIDDLWAADGRLVISPMGVVLQGRDAIAAHTSGVYEQNIAGRGLRFVYDQSAEADDASLLRWSMLSPDDAVVGRGVDIVFLDEQGRIRTVYMYMGVN